MVVDVDRRSVETTDIQQSPRSCEEWLPERILQEKHLGIIQLGYFPCNRSFCIGPSNFTWLTQPVKGGGLELLLVTEIDERASEGTHSQRTSHVTFTVGHVRLGHLVVPTNNVILPVWIRPVIWPTHEL